MESESDHITSEFKYGEQPSRATERGAVLTETMSRLTALRIDVTDRNLQIKASFDEAINSPDPQVRAGVASFPPFAGYEFAIDKAIPRLLADPSPIVRAALARNWWLERRDPTLLLKLLADPDPSVRVAITSRPPHYLERYGEAFTRTLLEDKAPAVRAAIANIWTPFMGSTSSARRLLSDSSPEVREAVLRNPAFKRLKLLGFAA